MNSDVIRLLLALHAFVTVFMTGLIWFVQIVHYPLLARVGKLEFATYEQQNTRRTTWVVGAPMLLETGLAGLIAWAVGGMLAWCGLALLGVIWLSTAFGQVPMHRILQNGFDSTAHGKLLRGNWVRTVSWSLRGLLSLWMLACP